MDASKITTSTGRKRRRPRAPALPIAVAAIVLVCVVAVLTRRQPGSPAAAAAPAGTRPPTVSASPSPLPTPPPPMVEQHGPWVAAVAPTSAPRLVPSPAAPTRRRFLPTATPRASECLAVRWSAGQSAAAWGQVLVAIDVVNRCGRILEPTEMRFWIAGYRQGALVQTAQGTAFQRLYPDRSESVMIGLPGSIDWYDRITVEVMD